MTTLVTFLTAFTCITAGVVICGITERHPDRRSTITVAALGVAAAIALAVLLVLAPRPANCYHPVHVQAVWFDGAWQCISAEEVG